MATSSGSTSSASILSVSGSSPSAEMTTASLSASFSLVPSNSLTPAVSSSSSISTPSTQDSASSTGTSLAFSAGQTSSSTAAVLSSASSSPFSMQSITTSTSTSSSSSALPSSQTGPSLTMTPVVSPTSSSTAATQATASSIPSSFSASSSTATSTVSAIVLSSPSSNQLSASTIPATASSSIASSSSTSSSLALPTAQCPLGDGSIYTGRDGSTYLIVCVQAYETIGIGILPFTTGNFSSCIDYCANQGTSCQGVTWNFGSNECSLKGSMSPTVNAAVRVYAAVRISGPLINGLRNDMNVILNGVFTNTLNPWVSTVTGLVGALTGLVNSLLFTLVNGIASVGIPLSLGLGQPVLYLTQTLSIAANQAWYLQADIFLINAQVSTTTSCTIYFRTDQEILWSYYYDRCSQQGTINGSGIVTKAASQFYTQTACTGSTDVTIGFDNIIWRLYPVAAGLNPIVLTAVQLLSNNDFSGGALAPWLVQSVVSATTDVTVTTARTLQVAFNRIAATASPCSITQTINRIRAGQTYWLQAYVGVTIASTAGLIGLGSRSATCDIVLGANLWSTTTTAASSVWNVNVTGIATSDFANLTLYANCYGNAVSTVTFDNIYLTRDVTLF